MTPAAWLVGLLLLASAACAVASEMDPAGRSLLGQSFVWDCEAVKRLGTPDSNLCCDMCNCLMHEHPSYRLAPSFPKFCMFSCNACVKDAMKCGGGDKLPLTCASVLLSKTNKETVSRCVDIYYDNGCDTGDCTTKADKCVGCCAAHPIKF